jgi:hypothetical protein
MRFTVVLFVFALVMLPVSSMGQDTGSSSATPQKEVPHNPQNADQSSATKRDYPAESVIVEQLKTVYRYSIQGTASREISNITLIQRWCCKAIRRGDDSICWKQSTRRS